MEAIIFTSPSGSKSTSLTGGEGSTIDPSGNNAAFDGYALKSSETYKLNKKIYQKFKIIGSIAAGSKPIKKRVKKFQSVEIMTGALIPKSFDTIIPIEQINFYPNKKNAKYIKSSWN